VPQSAPPSKAPSKALLELEQALLEAQAADGYPPDIPSDPAIPEKASASPQTDPPPRVVKTGEEGTVRRLRRARVSAQASSDLSVPATVPLAPERKRVIGISFDREGFAKCAPVRPRVRPIPPSRSIRIARKRLSKARASGRDPPVAQAPALEPLVDPTASGGTGPPSGEGAPASGEGSPPKKPRMGTSLPPVGGVVEPAESTEPESPPSSLPVAEARPAPSAQASYYITPDQPYTITFSWANSAQTQIKGSHLEAIAPSPNGPKHDAWLDGG